MTECDVRWRYHKCALDKGHGQDHKCACCGEGPYPSDVLTGADAPSLEVRQELHEARLMREQAWRRYMEDNDPPA